VTRSLPKEEAARGRRKACQQAGPVCKAARARGSVGQGGGRGTGDTDPIHGRGRDRGRGCGVPGESPAPVPAAEESAPPSAVLADRVDSPASPLLEQASAPGKRKLFNLLTYKLHALGDYMRTIRLFGMSDSYSTQPVCFSFLVAKMTDTYFM
jgi:hypothetical protein